MENLIPWILGIGCGIVALLVWLWLGAEWDLNTTRREIESSESEKRRLAEELSEYKQTLLSRESRLHEAAKPDHDVASQQSRLHSDIAELRRQLDESQGKLLELGEAKRAHAVVQAMGGGDTAALVRLDERMAELEQELAKDEAKLRELDLVCARLTEGERIRQALRDESARHQTQLEHWRQRSIESTESERRLVLIQEQFGELLAMQAALAESQRRFQDALVAITRLMDTPSKPMLQTVTFEEFKSVGRQAYPVAAENTPEMGSSQRSTSSDQAPVTKAQGQGGFMATPRNLKAS